VDKVAVSKGSGAAFEPNPTPTRGLVREFAQIGVFNS
jgi:hypothetical protein